MTEITFLVDRRSVTDSAVTVVRDLYGRMRRVRRQVLGSWPREVRKQAYREALQRHQQNQELYRYVQTGCGVRSVSVSKGATHVR